MKFGNKLLIFSFILFVLLLLFSGVASAEWEQFRGDANKTGQSYNINLPLSISNVSVTYYDDSSYVNFFATYQNNILYYSSNWDYIGVNLSNGSVVFKILAGSDVNLEAPMVFNFSNNSLYGNGVLYNYFYAYNLTTNSTLWTVNVQDTDDDQTPSYKNGVFYYINEYPGNGDLWAIYENGTLRWNYNMMNYNAGGSVAIDNDYIYLPSGNRTKKLYIENGTLASQSPIMGGTSELYYSTPSIDLNNVYVYTTTPNRIYAYYKSNMTEIWNYSVLGTANSYNYNMALDESNVYVLSRTGTIIYLEAINKTSGIPLWNYTACCNLDANTPTVDDNYVLFTNYSLPSALFIINKNNGTKANITIFNSSLGFAEGHYVNETGTVFVPGLDAGNYGYIYILESAPTVTNFDPSGYIDDTNGVVLDNAKVILSNSTYNVTDYSDTMGFWNVNIYADGTYNYNVTKNGFVTLTGSQVFTMGGTNNNFTMSPQSAQISGTIYEWTNTTGSKSIVGDLKSLKQILRGGGTYKVYTGATVTLPAPDGKNYVIKNIDVDLSGDSALIGILESGNYVFNNQFVEENKNYRYKVSETSTTELYLTMNVKNIFSGSGDVAFIEFIASYDVRQKSTISKWDLIYYWQTRFRSEMPGLILFFIDIIKWISFAPDKPDNKVTFNATAGVDSEVETVMDFSSDTNPTTFFLTIRTKNEGTQGKVGYGFTDDDIEISPNYKDVYIATGENSYLSDYRKFTDTDTDGDKKIKVWLYFYSGYGSKWDFNYFVTAFCTGCNLKPLADASIYQSFNNNTKSNTFGFYKLYVPFGTYNISYSKDGYESKSYSLTFNSTNNTLSKDVIINKSNVVINPFEYFLNILPDPATFGIPSTAYYKTLHDYSYYRISICPFNDDVNCLDYYDSDYGVEPDKESFVNLKSYPIGTYSAYLSGKDFFDFNWDIKATDNFTVISTVPTATWEASIYYLGDTMKLNIYVPSGTQNLTAYYPNGTVLYAGDYSSAITIQNKTFATLITPATNTTQDVYMPSGKYIVRITGNNNQSVTELLPISASNYSVSAPKNVVWGKSFTVEYTSPKTSELTITKSDGSLAFSTKTISGRKNSIYNTSSLENKADTLTIELIQNGLIKASTKININKGTTTGTEPDAMDILDGQVSMFGLGINAISKFLYALMWVAILTIVGFIATRGEAFGGLIAGVVPYFFFTYIEYIPKWVIVIVAVLIAWKLRL